MPSGCPGSRVYHHAPGLVDDNHIPIFIDNGKGDILGDGVHRFRVWKRDGNGDTGCSFVAFFQGFPLAGDEPLFQKALCVGPGHTGKAAAQVGIHPFSAFFRL